jgi:hypothetical protein
VTGPPFSQSASAPDNRPIEPATGTQKGWGERVVVLEFLLGDCHLGGCWRGGLCSASLNEHRRRTLIPTSAGLDHKAVCPAPAPRVGSHSLAQFQHSLECANGCGAAFRGANFPSDLTQPGNWRGFSGSNLGPAD